MARVFLSVCTLGSYAKNGSDDGSITISVVLNFHFFVFAFPVDKK